MLKEVYKQRFHTIFPDEKLILSTQAAMERQMQSSTAGKWRRPALAAAAIFLCVMFTAPVLAAASEPVYQMMYRVAPALAQYVIPVNQRDEDNGIRMEVVSARIYENTAKMYVTLEDLTGRRVDETCDLYDSYSIHRGFDSAASCQLVGYDRQSRKATFLICIEEWGGKDIEGEKITFSVREFLSGKKKELDLPVSLDLDSAGEEQGQAVWAIGTSGGGKAGVLPESPLALIPRQERFLSPVEGIDITAVGWIDGELHVQTAVTDPLKNDNHCSLHLRNDQGEAWPSLYSFSFSAEDEKGTRVDYHEFVFDVSQKEAARYSLYGNFYTSGLRTEGSWKVTFPLKKGG